LGYLLGWSWGIYGSPYYPAGVEPESHFLPQLVASTFSDYYNYNYSRPPRRFERALFKNGRGVGSWALVLAAASVVGGTIIAVITLLTWCVVVLRMCRRRRLHLLVPLIVPLLAVMGQLHVAIKYPIDGQGPVKGAYLQFAIAPLFALFGLGVDWLLRRRQGTSRGLWKTAAGVLGIVALVPIGAYSVFSRLP
jgi:hypothetical protein